MPGYKKDRMNMNANLYSLNIVWADNDFDKLYVYFNAKCGFYEVYCWSYYIILNTFSYYCASKLD